MLFTSLTFLYIFFPVTVIIYYFINRFLCKFRNIYLLFISCIFYLSFNIKLGIVILACASIVYLIGNYLKINRKKLILILVIFVFSIVLIVYKYSNFLIGIINAVFNREVDLLYLLMPLGLSFIIFSFISYLIDIYSGYENKSYVETMNYFLFFPKVISGPIVLWRDFIKITNDAKINIENTSYGIERIIIGLAKKVIIADILGTLISTILNNYLNVDSLSAWLCLLCYMMQIYYDFSGYSDIAIGLAFTFGYKFEENFNFPYTSISLSEFWNRWHISLGNFFKTYIYIPLGGNRNGNVYINLMIVFLVSGIWHGNGSSYIVWGILMGVFICFERFIKKKTQINRFIGWLFTFVFIYFSWILFMTPTFSDSINYLKIMFSNISYKDVDFTFKYYFNKQIIITMIVAIIGSIYNVLVPIERIKKLINQNYFLCICKYILLIGIFFISVIYIINSTYSPFIYFNF